MRREVYQGMWRALTPTPRPLQRAAGSGRRVVGVSARGRRGKHGAAAVVQEGRQEVGTGGLFCEKGAWITCFSGIALLIRLAPLEATQAEPCVEIGSEMAGLVRRRDSAMSRLNRFETRRMLAPS